MDLYLLWVDSFANYSFLSLVIFASPPTSTGTNHLKSSISNDHKINYSNWVTIDAFIPVSFHSIEHPIATWNLFGRHIDNDDEIPESTILQSKYLSKYSSHLTCNLLICVQTCTLNNSSIIWTSNGILLWIIFNNINGKCNSPINTNFGARCFSIHSLFSLRNRVWYHPLIHTQSIHLSNKQSLATSRTLYLGSFMQQASRKFRLEPSTMSQEQERRR